MSARILILADDLTGAVDSAVPFALVGGPHVGVSLACSVAPSGAPPILAVDTDSRGLPRNKALDLTLNCWKALIEGRTQLYMKMDSMLRGHWAGVVAALRGSAGMAIVAPAFPQAGRVTRNGRQYAVAPALKYGYGRTVDVDRATFLGDVTRQLVRDGVRAEHLSLDEIRGASDAGRLLVADSIARGTEALVCDAERPSDLVRVASLASGFEDSTYWVGSGGLARALAAKVLAPRDASSEDAVLARASRVVVAIGSAAAASSEQAKSLVAEGMVTELIVPSVVLAEGPDHPEWASWVDLFSQRIKAKDVLVRVGSARRWNREPAPNVHLGLAALVGSVSARVPIDGLVVTGGATARAVLDTLGTRQLSPVGEIEPGVVLSSCSSGPLVSVATKAGAFGSPRALVTALRSLKLGGLPKSATPQSPGD